jgi:hypothetical protein
MSAMLYKGIESQQELYDLLKELANEYRKRTRRHGKAELILIGGSSVLAAYSFRNSTSDVDALISGDSELLEAAHAVAFSHDLAPEWLNDDFKKTDSFTPNIIQYSQYLRTFANCVQIRSVTAGYLVAMKLRSFRTYKHDLSDVIGVVAEERKRGNFLTLDMVQKCTKDLYAVKFIIPKRGKEENNETNIHPRFRRSSPSSRDRRNRQASRWLGFLRFGDTVVLSTACCADEPKEGDFFPLTVDYVEKQYAAADPAELPSP